MNITDFINSLTAPKTHDKQTGAISASPVGEFAQGLVGAQAPNIEGAPITNPLDLTLDQAYSPYGAGEAVNLGLGMLGGGVVKAGKAGVEAASGAVKTALPEIKQVVKDSGGAQAGFIKVPGLSNSTDLPPITPDNPVRITLKPSVYGASHEAKVQSTVDNFVQGNTATQKYANLQPAMDSFGSQIQGIMATNPKVAPMAQIMSDYDKNLNSMGIYRTTASSKGAVQKAAQKYISQLYNNATGAPDSMDVTSIPDSALYQLKQGANQDAKSIYKKIDNGTSLSDKDNAILAARQTIDDTLSSLHPDVKQLSTMQSHLYDAADPIYDARSAELASADKLAANPPPPFSMTELLGGKSATLLPPIIKRPVDAAFRGDMRALAPLGGVALAGAGYAAGQATKNDITNTGGNSQNQIPDNNSDNQAHSNIQSITDYNKDVKSPTYIPDVGEIGDSAGNPLQMDTGTYNTQNAALTAQANALEQQVKLGIPSAQAQLDAVTRSQAALKTKYDTTQGLIAAHTDTTNKVQGLLDAKSLIANANPTWLQVLGGKANVVTTMKLAFDPGFAQWEGALTNLEKQYGIDLSVAKTAGSADVADKTIDQQVTQKIKQYRQTIKDNGGAGILAGNTPAPVGATKATATVPSPSASAPTVNPPTNMQLPQPVNQAAMATFAQ